MDDEVRPTEQAFKAMFEKGYSTWFNLQEMTTTASEFFIPFREHLFQMKTAFPHHPSFPNGLTIDTSYSNVAYTKGISSWKTALDCDLQPFDQELEISIATDSPTIIVISDVQPKFDTTGFFEKNDDYLAILMLAWTYILSARWAELISGGRGPEYTEYMADLVTAESALKDFSDRSANIVVDLEEADDDVLRWWLAVLAVEGGWNATVLTEKGITLHSPWYTKIFSNRRFSISRIAEPHVVPIRSASASFNTALKYLFDYCQLRGLHDQSQAALAAVLFIPATRFDNRAIQIPTPRLGTLEMNAEHISYEDISWSNNLNQLDKLLTLGCNPVGVKALLTSVFFQSGVECHICGAWLQGSFEFLDSVSDNKVLLRILAARDPALTFLWVGAFISGFHTRALQEARGGWWKIDLHTAAWTGTLMSFIQEPVSIPAARGGRVSRADECRLLYLAHDASYTIPPLFPFAPFGSTALEDVNLDVREHAGCGTGHILQYYSFAWKQNTNIHNPHVIQFPAGLILRSKNGWPCTNDCNSTITYSTLDIEDDETSKMVTQNIFTYVRDADGFPVAEKAICEHEWIDGLYFNEEDEEAYVPTGDALSCVGGNLHGWLLKSVTTRAATL